MSGELVDFFDDDIREILIDNIKEKGIINIIEDYCFDTDIHDQLIGELSFIRRTGNIPIMLLCVRKGDYINLLDNLSELECVIIKKKESIDKMTNILDRLKDNDNKNEYADFIQETEIYISDETKSYEKAYSQFYVED